MTSRTLGLWGSFPDKSFTWLYDIRPVSIKHQADLVVAVSWKEDRRIRAQVYSSTSLARADQRQVVNAIGQAAKNPQPSLKVPKLPTSDEIVVAPIDAVTPRLPRIHAGLITAIIPMPSNPLQVPLIELPDRTVTMRSEIFTAPVSTGERERDWTKTSDGQHIPFPKGYFLGETP
ncbi:hypothetical protein E4U30_001865 [Claviceps sp. LM220 group G6]|nr:hypothetical protein E4U15_004472 [Claviceps sp. LM218 group G6]KAG6095981.1 hypothetical protein E4U30_001865 [Claviceps sp. LM220 group G6]KAG6099344.1 hypothetical protein E4U31_004407 [Claviceps sp. LM219 group G6]